MKSQKPIIAHAHTSTVVVPAGKRARQYTEKWRGYTSRSDFAKLAKWQYEIREYTHMDEPITRAIVLHDGEWAWRYYRDNTYVYVRIRKPIPPEVFAKYYIQNIYATCVTLEVRVGAEIEQ